MARGATVIANDEARDVYRFEVRKSKTREAAKILIVPASIGSHENEGGRAETESSAHRTEISTESRRRGTQA
jgi:hypothetical protein